MTTNTLEESGQAMQGCWCKGDFNTHLPGHHLYEDYHDSSVSLVRTHEDGSCVLEKDQALQKFAALQKERDGAVKKSQDGYSSLNRTKGGAAKLWELHQMITGGGKNQVDDDENENEDDEDENKDENSDASEDESDQCDEQPVSLFARMRQTTSTTKAVPGSASKASVSKDGPRLGGGKETSAGPRLGGGKETSGGRTYFKE